MLIRLAVAILALVAVPAIADDRIELAKAVAVYKDAFEARSADDLVASLPQPVVARLAKERGEAVALVAETLGRDLFGNITVDAAKTVFGTAPDGTEFGLVPIVQVTIRRDKDPLEVTRPVDGRMKRVKVVAEYTTTARAHVLGIRENGSWRLVSLAHADAVEAFMEAYPAFKDVPLPRVRAQMQAKSVIVE